MIGDRADGFDRFCFVPQDAIGLPDGVSRWPATTAAPISTTLLASSHFPAAAFGSGREMRRTNDENGGMRHRA
jgi:hypothetical protein